MRWYEYKMEVDDVHAPDDLKEKLLAMQKARQAEQAASGTTPNPSSPRPLHWKRRKRPPSVSQSNGRRNWPPVWRCAVSACMVPR